MKTIIFLLLLATSAASHAQDLTKYLPHNPLFYNRIELSQLLQKKGLDSLKKQTFFKALMQNTLLISQRGNDSALTAVIEHIEHFGLSLSSDAHFSVSEVDSVVQFNFLFHINKRIELEKNMADLLPANDSTVFASIGKDFKLFIHNKVHYAWNDEVFVFGSAYSLRAETIALFDMNEQQRKELRTLENVRQSKIMHSVFHGDPKSNKKYLKDLFRNAAITSYIDLRHVFATYATLLSAAHLGMRAIDHQLFDSNQLLPYLDSKLHVGVFINGDELTIKTKGHPGKELRKKLFKVYNRRYNSAIFKYVPAKAIFSSGIKINTEAYINLTFDIMHDYFKNMPTYGQYATKAVTLLQTFLDEKGLGELVRGDVLFNLNAINKQQVTYTSYEYDDEYNSKEVTKTESINVPTFSVIGSTANAKQLEKLLDLGLDFSSKYVKENKVYTIKDRYFQPVGGSLFITVKKQLFFLSNDSSFIFNTVPNGGYACKERTTMQQQRYRRSKVFFLEFNADQLLQAFANDTSNGTTNEEEIAIFQDAAGKISAEQRFSCFGATSKIVYKTNDSAAVLPLLGSALNALYLERNRDYSESAAVDSTAAYPADSASTEGDYIYDLPHGAEEIDSTEAAPAVEAVEEAIPVKKQNATKPKKTKSKK